MQSRKSCFNVFHTAIFRKNAASFWPIWLSYTLMCLWVLPIYTWLQIKTLTLAEGTTQAERMEELLRSAVGSLHLAILPFPVFVFGAASGIAVFSYLYQARSANMVHALPVSRKELFLTNYCSGLLFLLAPQFLAFCVAVFVWFGSGVTRLEYLLRWLGLVAGEAFFAYSMAVFAAMLTGQAAIAAACFFLLNYLYQGLVAIADALMGMLVYGMDRGARDIWGGWLSPAPFLGENVRLIYQEEGQLLDLPKLAGLDCVPWYALAAVFFAALAFLLYKNRDIETASDVVAISCIKPVFRWCGGIGAAGVCTYLVWESLLSGMVGNMFWLVLVCSSVAGAAGFFLCEMLIRKKFMVFTGKRLAEGGVFLAVLAAALVCMETDLFGVEKRVPSAEEVAGIYLDGNYKSYLEEPEEISQCIAIHQGIIQEKDAYEAYFWENPGMEKRPSMSFRISYKLKNGRMLERFWYLPLKDCYLERQEGAVGKLLEFEKDPRRYMEYFFSSGYESLKIAEGGSFLHVNQNGDYNMLDLSNEEASKLYQALKEDILSGNYCIYPYEYRKWGTENYADSLTFSFRVPKGARLLQAEGEEFSLGKYPEAVTIPLTRGCHHLLGALQELGLLDEGEIPLTEREYLDVLEGEEAVVP